jgi:lipoprotein-anchoring transpeptidase ErfK/SrfK
MVHSMLPRLFAVIGAFLVLSASAALAAPVEETQASIGPGLPTGHDSPARRVVENLVDGGTTDVDELVDSIAEENYGKLDHLIINIADQTIYECNMAGQVLRTGRISSGRKGYDTPLGKYKVHTRSPKAYSQKYDAWMLNWMGFTSDGNYGIHGLEGSSYERHLGNVASHGCIRLSRKYAKDLYTRVKVGMPVTIVNEKKLALAEYKPISREDALDMVLEVLSPTDPEKVFY